MELQWEWLGGLPPLRKAVVIGGGASVIDLADLLARAGLDTRISDGADVEFAGVDLVCLALPSRELPAELDRVGPRIGQRSAVLILLDEVAGRHGIAPALDLGERTGARAVATLTESAARGESNGNDASTRLVLATDNADFRAQFSDVLTRAGIDVAAGDEQVAAARPRSATGRFRERATAGLRG